MDEQPLTVGLDSAMVTWEELGCHGYSTDQKEELYYEFLTDHLDKCKGDYRASTRGIWFARGNEAVMFKMTYAGKFS